MVDLSGYKLTFDDEFNNRSISQTGQGTTWADIRPQWRLDANSDIGFGHSSFVDPASGYDPFKVEGGALSITAVPDRTPSGYPGSWESGLITTQGHFSQTYGYYEMRADLSDTKGAWDAFWMLPNAPASNPNHLPGWQELDVVEHYGDYGQGVYNTIHTTDQTPNIPWQQNRQVYSENPALLSGYHTYGMDWEADKISFYVDGQLVGSQATPSDMHGPMYLLADLATQGAGDNDADVAGVPITSKIDYIRAYSNNPNATAVAQGAVSAPDGHDPGLYGATTANAPATRGSSASAPPSQGSSATASQSGANAAGPSPASVGSGPDQLILNISEDAYKGDAQYTVSVDGKQVGGTQTAHALHAAGQSAQLLIQGDWAAGDHTVSVNFLNDAYAGTSNTDRNLYVDGASYDGASVANSKLSLMSAGQQSFTIKDPGTTTPAATIGAGPDDLMLHLSEDAYKGDAKYTVSVDGKQVGGTLSAHAAHASGQSDLLLVRGDWSSGSHDVAVTFLNDAYAGTATTDRNLYVDGASYNGTDVHGAKQSLLSAGTKHFSFG